MARYSLRNWQKARARDFNPTLSNLHLNDDLLKWRSPPVGTLKINTDATLFSLPNRFSFAMVVRDHTCQIIEAKSSFRAGLVSPDVAEAIGRT